MAIELVNLRDNRPPRDAPLNPGERITRLNPTYREHMHEEYLLEQEIYRRIGIENGNEKIAQARQVLKLLT